MPGRNTPWPHRGGARKIPEIQNAAQVTVRFLASGFAAASAWCVLAGWRVGSLGLHSCSRSDEIFRPSAGSPNLPYQSSTYRTTEPCLPVFAVTSHAAVRYSSCTITKGRPRGGPPRGGSSALAERAGTNQDMRAVLLSTAATLLRLAAAGQGDPLGSTDAVSQLVCYNSKAGWV